MEKDSKKQEQEAEVMYEKLRVKHSLPPFDDLDRNFSTGTLEHGNYILRSIVVKLADRCDFMLKIINGVIQPESRLSDMQEAQSLGPAEKESLLLLFKKLSYFEKEFLIIEFDYEEERAAKCIKDFYAEWQQLKPMFIGILSVMQGTWNTNSSSRQEYSYFG